ncbi:PPR18 protein, partial [Polypterus senegalus]|nr:PPR18 protein [Polypterus senegalus]
MSSAGLPEWKVQLLEKKRREEEESRRKEKEQEERLARMPAWKREIIERRKAKLSNAGITGSSGSFSECGDQGAGDAQNSEATRYTDLGKEMSTVLRETIAPVHENPFIKLEKKTQERKNIVPPKTEEATSANPCKVKQIADIYGQRIPGIRTIRAENIIIIESDDAVQTPRHDSKGEMGKGHYVENHLSELIAGRGSVTEIHASEVLIIKPTLSRSVEDLNSLNKPTAAGRGRVSKLLSKFDGQDTTRCRPVRSRSIENIIMDGDGNEQSGRRFPEFHSAKCSFLPSQNWDGQKVEKQSSKRSERSVTPPPLSQSGSGTCPTDNSKRLQHNVVAGYKSQFEARSSVKKRQPSPKRSFSCPPSGEESMNNQAKHIQKDINEDSFCNTRVTQPKKLSEDSSLHSHHHGSLNEGQEIIKETSITGSYGKRQNLYLSGLANAHSPPDLNEHDDGIIYKQDNLCSQMKGDGFEILPAICPDPSLIPESDVQARALANLRAQSRYTFVVVPKRQQQQTPLLKVSKDNGESINSNEEGKEVAISYEPPVSREYLHETDGGLKLAIQDQPKKDLLSCMTLHQQEENEVCTEKEVGVPCTHFSAKLLQTQGLASSSLQSTAEPLSHFAQEEVQTAADPGAAEKLASTTEPVLPCQGDGEAVKSGLQPSCEGEEDQSRGASMSRIYNLKPVMARDNSAPAATSTAVKEDVRATSFPVRNILNKTALSNRTERNVAQVSPVSVQENQSLESSGPASGRSLGKGHVRTGAATIETTPLQDTVFKPTLLGRPGMQKKGNTITINPRKMTSNSTNGNPDTATSSNTTSLENGASDSAVDKNDVSKLKKRYPTAEEIEVIGGYLSLEKSCLAKKDTCKKKVVQEEHLAQWSWSNQAVKGMLKAKGLKREQEGYAAKSACCGFLTCWNVRFIRNYLTGPVVWNPAVMAKTMRFDEDHLETTFEYPSESFLLAELGLDDKEVIPPPPARTPAVNDDDEEEEATLFTHRGAPGSTSRGKPLIVGDRLDNDFSVPCQMTDSSIGAMRFGVIVHGYLEKVV